MGNRRTFILGLAGIASVAPAIVTAAPAPAPDFDNAAADLARRFASSWNARDGDAYGSAYWPDAELVDPSGNIWNGRAAIVRTHLDLWARGPTTATATVRRVRPLSPTLMVVDITTTVAGFPRLPPGARSDAQGRVFSNLKHVVEKRDGEWKILASQNTFIA
jgi:uncharacterized protein (TIGR02246 family)